MAIHGKNALIYVSAVEIVGGNTWSLSIATDNVEVPKFGDQWKDRVTGMSGWSGNITAWDQVTSNPIADAAVAGTTVSLLIYPDRNTLGTYYNGSVIFGMSAAGGVAAGVTQDGDFVGDGALTQTGWA